MGNGVYFSDAEETPPKATIELGVRLMFGAALDERGTVRECVADVAVDERHKIAEFILPGRHFRQVLQVLLLPV